MIFHITIMSILSLIQIICLIIFRYLASGCSFSELHYSYRLGITTIREFVQQVCQAIWIKLKDTYLPAPSKDRWLEIASRFETVANFPHCIGAVDGKHIRVIKPHHTGSVNYNYKHYFSYVLLAVCDANYRFVAINIGADGRESDSTIFKDSIFYKSLVNNELNLPVGAPLSESTKDPMPYVFVGDEAFGLSNHLMRPYGGKHLNTNKRIFNYRLSRARRFVECTFGILSNKWRIFHRPLNVKRDFAMNIIKACCLLHNFVRVKDTRGFIVEDTLCVGPGLHTLSIGPMERGARSAVRYRNQFADYFVNEGAVSWQHKRI